MAQHQMSMFDFHQSTAKEIKASIEIGTALGYSGDELKQFITDERMRIDKEKERERELRLITDLSTAPYDQKDLASSVVHLHGVVGNKTGWTSQASGGQISRRRCN